MKTKTYVILALLVLGGIVIYLVTKNNMETTSTKQPPVVVMAIEHATLALGFDDVTVYVDPTGGLDAFKEIPPADIVLITDVHRDHLDIETLLAVIGDAKLIVPEAVKQQLPDTLASRAQVLDNDESENEDGLTITAVPMYNVPEAPDAFHVKGRGNGYIVQKQGTHVYVAGDTGGTPEMRALKEIDIAFVPMNLPYTMSVQDAAEAVLAFQPKVVYPYHYRNQDGSLSEVSKFKELVDAGNPEIQVVLGSWY